MARKPVGWKARMAAPPNRSGGSEEPPAPGASRATTVTSSLSSSTPTLSIALPLATWPPDWAERVGGKDCPMCAQGRPDEDEWGVRVLAGRFSDAYLQRASWQTGYTIVVWRGRHV